MIDSLHIFTVYLWAVVLILFEPLILHEEQVQRVLYFIEFLQNWSWPLDLSHQILDYLISLVNLSFFMVADLHLKSEILL